MNKIKRWLSSDNVELTWFFIGFFVADGLFNVGRRDFLAALFCFGLAWANYYFRKPNKDQL